MGSYEKAYVRAADVRGLGGFTVSGAHGGWRAMVHRTGPSRTHPATSHPQCASCSSPSPQPRKRSALAESSPVARASR
eukprot:2100351-Prymnesium_polylepis.2